MTWRKHERGTSDRPRIAAHSNHGRHEETGRPAQRVEFGLVILDGDLHVHYVNARAKTLLNHNTVASGEPTALDPIPLQIVQAAVSVREQWIASHDKAIAGEVHIDRAFRRERRAYDITATGLTHASRDLSKYAILVRIVPAETAAADLEPAMC